MKDYSKQLPTTDDEAREALRQCCQDAWTAHGRADEFIVKIYNSHRKFGDDILTAYSKTLKTAVESLRKVIHNEYRLPSSKKE